MIWPMSRMRAACNPRFVPSGTLAWPTAVAELGVYQGAAADFEPEDEYNKGGYW